MNLSNKSKNLSVFYGPMFSGKTDKLIQKILEYKKAKKNILAFKPSIDNRTPNIFSRTNNQVEAIVINDSKQIIDYLNNVKWNVDAIFIDELQFFDNQIIYYIKKILQETNIKIYVSGLDTDFKKEWFQNVKEILKICDKDNQIHLFARCAICNQKAEWSARKVNNEYVIDNGPIIQIESFTNNKTEYVPLCDAHHPIHFKQNEKNTFSQEYFG